MNEIKKTKAKAKAKAPGVAAKSKSTAKATKTKRSAIERARSFIEENKREGLGTLVGVPEGRHAVWMVPGEIGSRADQSRRRWAAKGYEHCPEAYASGIDGSEVWTCPREVHELLIEYRTQRVDEAKRRLLEQWKIDAETVEHIH